MEDPKAISEGCFIRVVYHYLLKHSTDAQRHSKEYQEYLAREALALHKEYWQLWWENE